MIWTNVHKYFYIYKYIHKYICYTCIMSYFKHREVYGLVDPRDHKIKYIGCAVFPGGRYNMHTIKTKKNIYLKDLWIDYLLEKKMKPMLVILDSFDNKEDAYKREKDLIIYYSNKSIIYNTKYNVKLKNFKLDYKGKLPNHPMSEILLKSIKSV